MKVCVPILSFLYFFIDFCESKDYYIGMLRKHDSIVARDRVYKENTPYAFNEVNYGREFRCKITYLKMEDKLRGTRGPKYQIVRGGLGKTYIVVRIKTYDKPIYLDVTVGCPVKVKQPTTELITLPDEETTTVVDEITINNNDTTGDDNNATTSQTDSSNNNSDSETTTMSPDGNDGNSSDTNNTLRRSEDIDIYSELQDVLETLKTNGKYKVATLKEEVDKSKILSMATDGKINLFEKISTEEIDFDELKDILSKITLQNDYTISEVIKKLINSIGLEDELTKLGEIIKTLKIDKKADLVTKINGLVDFPKKDNIVSAINALKNENVEIEDLKENLKGKINDVTTLKEAIEKLIKTLSQ